MFPIWELVSSTSKMPFKEHVDSSAHCMRLKGICIEPVGNENACFDITLLCK
jgi:hypothetical protein